MSQPDDVQDVQPAPALSREGGLIATDRTALVVDLDGTLLRTDMLYESYFASIKDGVHHHRSVLRALGRGKASLKAYLADVTVLDCSLLPINDEVLEFARRAKADGQPVYLATATNRRLAEQIALQFPIFDGIFASDETINLAGVAKSKQLIETFGDQGFDYIGNSTADFAVWAHARHAYVVGNVAKLTRQAQQRGIDLQPLSEIAFSARSWLKALRIHQYAKNVLIFVPLLTSHAYSISSCVAALLAFISFSLCASSVYLLNDLIDLRADRQHPTKRLRPFANGTIPLQHGFVAIPALLTVSYACAFMTSWPFIAVLTAYLALTLAYSFTLKRRLMVDIVVLSALYSIRVIAGSAATSVVPSEWLLAFSMFIFVCLALVKRYVELALRIDRELPDPSNRNYRLMDLPIIGALAAASGFNAVTIFSLYISSPAVAGLYRHPGVLWLICPILMYWLSRIVILAHRRVVDDDPIVFALRDRNSRVCAAAMVVLVLLAT
jgi:4-hydroxybenzoate polyprenyltransferase/phosphoserine phosphatase